MHKIIDYSLLIGVIDLDDKLTQEEIIELERLEKLGLVYMDIERNRAFILGIIDYF